jgi:hypothetical protein
MDCLTRRQGGVPTYVLFLRIDRNLTPNENAF